MSNLSELIRVAQHQAGSMCTECLVRGITDEADSLDGKLASLEMAVTGRGSAPDSEMRYIESFGEVMATVLTLAAFAAELVNNRVTGWEFLAAISSPGISLN